MGGLVASKENWEKGTVTALKLAVPFEQKRKERKQLKQNDYLHCLFKFKMIDIMLGSESPSVTNRI